MKREYLRGVCSALHQPGREASVYVNKKYMRGSEVICEVCLLSCTTQGVTNVRMYVSKEHTIRREISVCSLQVVMEGPQLTLSLPRTTQGVEVVNGGGRELDEKATQRF